MWCGVGSLAQLHSAGGWAALQGPRKLSSHVCASALSLWPTLSVGSLLFQSSGLSFTWQPDPKRAKMEVARILSIWVWNWQGIAPPRLFERENTSLLLMEERLRPPGKEGINGGHLWRLYHLMQKGEFNIRMGRYLKGPKGRNTAWPQESFSSHLTC